MNSTTLIPQGLWLPLITPFRNGELDEVSLRRLIKHYSAEPLGGLILAGTTGESLTLDEHETRSLAEIAADELMRLGRETPLLLGLSGSDTRRMVKTLEQVAHWPINGYLIACPHYTRPSQAGLVQHFSALADASGRPMLIYNIPYRTGVNLGNDAMLQLASHPNIVGVKDCCADLSQSLELIRRRPAGFSVLTGEDAQYHNLLAQGADGAILASAHIATTTFAAIRSKLVQGDQAGAIALWNGIADLPRLLFAEPSPGALKHWLWRTGLIDSPELRLPMTPVSAELAARIDGEMTRIGKAA